MAILPIFEREETRAIMEDLLIRPMSAHELNESVVIRQSMCSTSTLYRRLRDLSMGSIIEKQEGNYIVTEFGIKVYTEFQQTRAKIRLGHRELKILQKFRQRTYAQAIRHSSSISPNDLGRILDILISQGLIMVDETVNESLLSSRGRKPVLYGLTMKGERAIEDQKKLEEEVRKGKK